MDEVASLLRGLIADDVAAEYQAFERRIAKAVSDAYVRLARLGMTDSDIVRTLGIEERSAA